MVEELTKLRVDIICLQETDQLQVHEHDDEFIQELETLMPQFRFFRHYPGEHSWALGMLVHKKHWRHIRKFEVHDRAMSLVLQSGANQVFKIINVHGHATTTPSSA